MRISAFISLILTILFSAYLFASSQVKPTTFYDPNIFKNGDLIFRKGTGFFSDFFCSFGNEKALYSHVGIVRKDEGKVFVVHTEASELTGIGHSKQESVEEFLSPTISEYGAVYRLKKLNKKIEKNVAINAYLYAIKKIPFDKNFDLSTKNELYCTELVNDIYNSIGINLIKYPKVISINIGEKTINKKFILINQLSENENFYLVTKFN